MTGGPALILLQPAGSAEGRAITHAALLEGLPVARVAMERLGEHATALREGRALPVGSVEFVLSAMQHGGIEPPAPLSYPPVLARFLKRQVGVSTAAEAMAAPAGSAGVFVKPVQTKLFTGFVYHLGRSDDDYDEHDREQIAALRLLAADCPVWLGEPVAFQSEWRYYVMHGRLLGAARYDPAGEDSAPAPDCDVVQQVIAAAGGAGMPCAYGLDIGVLANGQTALVEMNDAWALGLYGRSVEPARFLDMLWARWEQLRTSSGARLSVD